MSGQKKPQGMSGKFGIGAAGAEWHVIPFPETKAEREWLIAELFISGFKGWVAMESEPSLAPFEGLVQNDENDLDFTVETAGGGKLLELVEFAPLDDHGPTFSHAPKALSPNEKATLAAGLIRMKSEHQGGDGRLLLLYATEHAFKIAPFPVEILRRTLAAQQPNFDRVYYVSLHDLVSASVTEIYPGKPHHYGGDLTDEQLAATADRAVIPHPTDMQIRVTLRCPLGALFGRKRLLMNLEIHLPGKLQIRR